MDNHSLLIVEDSDEDFEVSTWALKKAGFSYPIHRSTNVEQVLKIFSDESPNVNSYPTLILLDLNLPGMNGKQFLEKIRQFKCMPAVPIIILSNSKNQKDILACYELGAAGYFYKPMDLEAYVEKMKIINAYWFKGVDLPLH